MNWSFKKPILQSKKQKTKAAAILQQPLHNISPTSWHLQGTIGYISEYSMGVYSKTRSTVRAMENTMHEGSTPPTWINIKVW